MLQVIGLRLADERYDVFFFVGGVGGDFDFILAGEPAKGGEHFFVFQFGDFLDLLDAEGLCFVEGLPYGTGIVAECFNISFPGQPRLHSETLS